MEILDLINTSLADSPNALAHLELLFRIKFWLLLILAFYFVSLPYRERKKRKADLHSRAVQPNGKDGNFLA
jgi:hypothetical protein